MLSAVLLLVALFGAPSTIFGSDASQIADINPGSAGSFPSNLTVFSKTLFFNAYNLSTGRELWKTDGTNTVMVADINETADDVGSGSLEGNDSLPAWLTEYNGALYFSAYDPRRGAELWRYDGVGVARVADINPDANDTIKTSPNSSWPAELTVLNNALYFSANNGSVRPNYELWKYDGVTASLVTNIHADIGTNYSSYPSRLKLFNNAIYFMADNGTNGFELWKHDGVKTTLLADINPGSEQSSSYPQQFQEFQGNLYFQALRDDVGFELWRTDGTNVTLVSDINPTSPGSYPEYLTPFNGALYFRATSPSGGSELWRCDGTNTSLAADINPTGDSFPKNLTVFGSQLCFAADDGVHGWELWKYDGVSAQIVTNLNAEGDAFPENLTVLNGMLYFSATTPDTGYELWKYDGTNVTLAADINPGPGDSFPQFIRVYDDKLFFRATDDGVSNWELWSYTPPASSPPPDVTITIKTIELRGNDVHLTWTTAGGSTNTVQFSVNVTGPYNDLSPQIIPSGTGEVTTEYTDPGAITSSQARFYRIKRL